MMKEAVKTRLQPIGKRVLVKRLEAEQTMKGGIILPDTAKKKQESARVVALGTEQKIPFPVAVGDKILMDKYSGQEVTVEGEEYVILQADDIIAIVE
jgi:chaperonin GroES